MAKKNITEGRTLDIIRTELVEAVDKYNLSESAEERVALELTHKNLVDEWNQLSLLTTYAECMEDEFPLVALGKAYTYATIGTKDNRHQEVIKGVKRSVSTRSVEDNKRLLSITKFVAWAKETNKDLTADKLWLEKWGDTRTAVSKQWEKFFNSKGEEYKVKIGSMKKQLQKLFDAMVFIETKPGSDLNAIVADGKMVKWMFGLSNQRKVNTKTKELGIGNLPSSLWEQLAMDVWHMACDKKEYEVVYGDPVEEKAEDATNADENAENKDTEAK